jgi:RNA polymerase sigma factor (TIGR02999 family)
MNDVTRILSAVEQGDPHAAAELLPLVYEELRQLAAQRLAQEKPGQTLQATALVHEAYLRLVASGEPSGRREPHWDSRGHFFAAAAEAMRRILVENARHKRSQKAGHGRQRRPLDDVEATVNGSADDLLALDEALTKLHRENQPAAALAKLRLFTGLAVDEAADALRVSRRTGFRLWTYARAFLQAELAADGPGAGV